MTKGYGGRQMIKRIDVQTNDAQHPNLQLVVKGKVKKFATIRPKRVRLNGVVGDVIRQTVAIIPEKAYPFRIIETSAKPGDNIKFTLEEKPGESGHEYELIIENTHQKAGRYYEAVVLKTDSEIKPELEIRVYGNIVKPKSKTPPVSESSPTIKKLAEGKPAVKTTPTKKDTSGGVKINISKGTKTE